MGGAMSTEMGFAPPAAEVRAPAEDVRAFWAGRLAALVGLSGLALVVATIVAAGHRALSDAWIAPQQLSPDSDRVVDLRIQQTKEKADRARLVAEIAGIVEEVSAVDVSLKRMQRLSGDYSGALEWSTEAEGKELRALAEQVDQLKAKRAMLTELQHEQQALLDRADRDRADGLITRSDFDRQAVEVHQLGVDLQDCEIELARLEAERSRATTRGQALWSAASTHADPGAHARAELSPDVVKFYDDKARIELEITRLQAEKRSVEARRGAAQQAVDDMDQLLRELEAKPLYRATQHDTDIAFVPYDQLRRLAVGDAVYACVWSVFACRAVGLVSEVVSGEVVAQDPWGDLARGQYVVLDMRDRSALLERVLRVRHTGRT
jgi:hypothetical protein